MFVQYEWIIFEQDKLTRIKKILTKQHLHQTKVTMTMIEAIKVTLNVDSQ